MDKLLYKAFSILIFFSVVNSDVEASDWARPPQEIAVKVENYSLERGNEDYLPKSLGDIGNSNKPIHLILTEKIVNNRGDLSSFVNLFKEIVVKNLILDFQSLNPEIDTLHFLVDNPHVESIRFTNAANFEGYNLSFIVNNKKLKKVYFSGLKSFVYAGKLLFKNPALTHIDFSGLDKMVMLGYQSLSENKSLVSISFKGLRSLESIKGSVLSNNKKLRTVNFEGADFLQTIDRDFLSNNPSLKELDLRPLKSLRFIGQGFLHNTPVKTIYVANEEQKKLVEPHVKNVDIVIKK